MVRYHSTPDQPGKNKNTWLNTLKMRSLSCHKTYYFIIKKEYYVYEVKYLNTYGNLKVESYTFGDNGTKTLPQYTLLKQHLLATFSNGGSQTEIVINKDIM